MSNNPSKLSLRHSDGVGGYLLYEAVSPCAVLWCDPAGRGCCRRDPVVSQLSANSRTPHSSRGQVQEPCVDQRQDHCRSERSIFLFRVFLTHPETQMGVKRMTITLNILLCFQLAMKYHRDLPQREPWACNGEFDVCRGLFVYNLGFTILKHFVFLNSVDRSICQSVSPARRQEDQQEEDLHQEGRH